MTRDRFIERAAAGILDEYAGDISHAAAVRYATLALDAVGAWERFEATTALREILQGEQS